MADYTEAVASDEQKPSSRDRERGGYHGNNREPRMNTPETGQDDITKRLRDTFDRWNNPPSPELPDGAGVLLEAADAIELLRTRNSNATGRLVSPELQAEIKAMGERIAAGDDAVIVVRLGRVAVVSLQKLAKIR